MRVQEDDSGCGDLEMRESAECFGRLGRESERSAVDNVYRIIKELSKLGRKSR